jgi:pimeloyl-[acyl-carrier protein] methyl ester esterase
VKLHSEARGAGEPFVLLHGWGFHCGAWNGFADALERRFRVLRLDLPGHGHSGESPLATLDVLADDIAASIPDRAIACGWSMGGLAALALALRHPRKVRALGLIAATPCFARRRGWVHGMPAAALDEFGRGLRDDADAALGGFVRLTALGAARSRSTAQAMTALLAERPRARAQALEAGLGILRSTDLRERTKSLALPTVIVHGAQDRVVPVGAGRWLARAMSNARLVELADAGHLPFATHRDATLAAVRALHG